MGDAASATLATLVTAGLDLRLLPAVPVFGMVLVMPLGWVTVLAAAGGYEQRHLGTGFEDFRRVWSASALALAAVVAVSWAAHLQVSRGFVVAVIPLAGLLTLVQRHGQRRWLRRQRTHGHHLRTALLVGHRSDVAALHEQLIRETHHGYQAVGCCLLTTEDRSIAGLPVLGRLDDVPRVAGFHEIDIVAVLPAPDLPAGRLRDLARGLDGTRTELLVAPALADLVRPGILTRPTYGLPLLRIERPELRGARRLVKAAFDRGSALLLLVLVLPALTAIALAIRATGRGPLLGRQERIGRGGRVFQMLAFRTTVAGGPMSDDGVLVPLRRDTATSVGLFLRRHGLDHLPELLNVLTGRMSLVGARPPRRTELEGCGTDVRRVPLVKPGMTGLWQLSGQESLPWDDAGRLDLDYVENWSLALDLMILGRTLQAVVRGRNLH